MKHLKGIIVFVLLLSVIPSGTNNQAGYAQAGNEEWQSVPSGFEDNADYEVVNHMKVRAATEEERAFLFSFIPGKDGSEETLIECRDVLENCVEVRQHGSQLRLTDEAEKRIMEQAGNPDESSALHKIPGQHSIY